MFPAGDTAAAAFFYRGHTLVSNETTWRRLGVWLPPWDGGTALPASELSGAYCCFVAGDLVTTGIYGTPGHGALKSEGPTQRKVTAQTRVMVPQRGGPD